jgi:hypothetical protein
MSMKKFEASLSQRRTLLLKYNGTHMLINYTALLCNKGGERGHLLMKVHIKYYSIG